MPCYSTIRTKLDNGERLEAALKALGYVVDKNSHGDIFAMKDGQRTVFEKGATFSVRGWTTGLETISRKYAEIGVREWARKRNFAVTENDGVRIHLVSRRG